ncbi:hypothetical protein N7509_000227 [Penicillium cosmopolitanum]|uniref:Nucleoside phosphorylase domain-containing protein n=1 Tax=Penicillium cosmopolitanum TaxID=1131564 RepID=A0A9W9WCL4_9EURO|nr:uncharacterized protein N7509_000227 [Penicillium cosmopolitanum]KAJ5414893.1 hypothetical protein N7509_000227 [Penicillium cosmopolitanum]
MSDPAGYTVGWICALRVEYIAAQELLDEEHESPSFVSPNDANDYTLGKIGEHQVVIAVMPDGEYGTASAANVATNMLNSFHNIRIGLMVGIGGGVPTQNHDIRLGDVVVSAPRNGVGGVFQYDFGKSIQGQSFQHTRFLNQPPTTLRTAITGLQTQYKRKGHQLQGAIDSILDNNSRLRREYQRPLPNTDRLFRATVIHDQGCCDSSGANNPSNLVLRSERAKEEDNPAIHYGLIASGNQLMKDALMRDKLAAERDVLCFEMEAGGLMNTFPCLVIRGICDYSDSHKNKEWQGYAAMVAAAYAKDLLQRIPLSRIEAEDKINVLISERQEVTNQQLDRLNSEQERYHIEQKDRALTDQQDRCLQMFKILSYEEQKNLNPRKAEGTCLWAIQSAEFIRWSESSCNDLLWTICVFDALDECQQVHQRRLIEKIHSFQCQPSSSIQGACLKFLVTSRSYDGIQNSPKAITNPFQYLSLKGEDYSDQIHKEIDTVVKMKVKELARDERLPHNVTPMGEIRSTFEESLRPSEELVRSIRMIPASVNEAYERILNRVPPSQVSNIRTILQIVVAANRPLTMVELARAVDIAIPPQHTADKLDPNLLKKKLRRYCGLFIFSQSKIYLIHQTAKEFLESKESWRQSVNFQDAHLSLAKICMTYLHEIMFQENEVHFLQKRGDRSRSDGLLIYSATHWISHLISGSTAGTELLQMAGNLCGETRASVWTQFVEPPFWYYRFDNEPLPFFWAARWGLVDVADILLQDPEIQVTADIIEKAVAHTSGNDTVIRLLFDRRVNEISITDEVLQTAAANRSGGFVIMKLLLDRRGGDITVTDKVMQKAAANSSSGLSIMRLLLNRKGPEIKVTIADATEEENWEIEKLKTEV